MGYDLKNMTGKQVLILAKSISGMDCEDIAEKSKLPYSTIRQYFKDNPNSEYFPSFYRIPKLCRALGNNLLLEWQKAQLEELNPDNSSRLKSGTDLLSRVNNLGQELGDVHQSVSDALGDGVVEPNEASELSGELRDVEMASRKLREDLQPIAGQDKGQVLRGKKLETINMKED